MPPARGSATGPRQCHGPAAVPPAPGTFALSPCAACSPPRQSFAEGSRSATSPALPLGTAHAHAHAHARALRRVPGRGGRRRDSSAFPVPPSGTARPRRAAPRGGEQAVAAGRERARVRAGSEDASVPCSGRDPPVAHGGAMGSRRLLLLLLGAALPFLGPVESADAVSAERSLVWGPGLEAGPTLPVRYFYIQAVSVAGRNFSRSPPGTVLRGGRGRETETLPGPAMSAQEPVELPTPSPLPVSFSLPCPPSSVCCSAAGPWLPSPLSPLSPSEYPVRPRTARGTPASGARVRIPSPWCSPVPRSLELRLLTHGLL